MTVEQSINRMRTWRGRRFNLRFYEVTKPNPHPRTLAQMVELPRQGTMGEEIDVIRSPVENVEQQR